MALQNGDGLVVQPPAVAAQSELDTWFNPAVLPQQGAPTCITHTMLKLPDHFDTTFYQTVQKALEGILTRLTTRHAAADLLVDLEQQNDGDDSASNMEDDY